VTRSELIDGVKELRSALQETNLSKLLGPAEKKDDGSERASRLLEALKQYAIRAHRFKPATRRLVEIFNLDPLEVTALWLRLLDPTPATSTMRKRIAFAVSNLPLIAEMLEPEIFAKLKSQPLEGSPYKDMRVLSVTVFEQENLFSSPLRLANVLEAVNHFYSACALLEDESPSTLSVVACDSGSDKSFDFLGIAKVMDCVERLIGTIWDRAFFFRERQFEERLELVAKSLPIIERIDSMQNQKQLDPEMAQILKRHIFDGSNKFLQSGATIPKIEDRSEYNPRELLSPVQKLLVAAPEELTRESNDSHESIEDVSAEIEENNAARKKLNISSLTDDEQEELLRLVQKSRKDGIATSAQHDTPEVRIPNDLDDEI
jgi:hypothetical protein